MMFLLLIMLLVGANAQYCRTSMYISPSGGYKQIWSPRYPTKYGPSTNCSWQVYTDLDKRLSLDCSFTELENKDSNCFDKLSVVGSTLYDNEDFCEPFNAHSSTNNMTLQFTSWPQSKGGRFMCTVRAINKDECNCGWHEMQREVISGGTEVKVNEFPMMVGIIDFVLRVPRCGGAIISKNFVLTAAHCLQGLNVNRFGLLVGDHSLKKGNETNSTRLLRAAEFFIHPNYSYPMNDIALIKSATPIDFNENVGPVCLPFNRPFLPAIEEDLTVLGWGTTFSGGPVSDVLLKTDVKVVPESRCRAIFKNIVSSDLIVCTFSPGRDSCQMDSGGPLILPELRTISYFLAALVSFGRGCGGPDPSVNTKITPYLDWIQRQTGDEFCIK